MPNEDAALDDSASVSPDAVAHTPTALRDKRKHVRDVADAGANVLIPGPAFTPSRCDGEVQDSPDRLSNGVDAEKHDDACERTSAKRPRHQSVTANGSDSHSARDGTLPAAPTSAARASTPGVPAEHRTAGAEGSEASKNAATEGEAAKADTSVPKGATGKREDYLVWDDYFMSVAFLSAMRSKDPSTQVGACIVNREKRIVGIGYNGFPMGCSDDCLPWAREAAEELDTKYPYVCHAEMNAILNKNSADVKGCSLKKKVLPLGFLSESGQPMILRNVVSRFSVELGGGKSFESPLRVGIAGNDTSMRIYVALFPCNECAKLIIQSGITEVIYLSDKYHHTNSMKASRRLFELSGVKCRQYVPRQDRVVIDFSSVPR